MDETFKTEEEIKEEVRTIIRGKLRSTILWKWFSFVGVLCSIFAAAIHAYKGEMPAVLLMGACLAINAFNMKSYRKRQEIWTVSLKLASEGVLNGIEKSS